MTARLRHACMLVLALAACSSGEPELENLEGVGFTLNVDPTTGHTDLRQAGTRPTLSFAPRRPAFGRVRVGDQRMWLDRPEAYRREPRRIELDYSVAAPGLARFRVTAALQLVDEGRAFEVSFEASGIGDQAAPSFVPELAMSLLARHEVQVMLPVGSGRRIPAEALEGAWRMYDGRAHLTMQMVAIDRGATGLLVSWDEPRAELRAKPLEGGWGGLPRTTLALWGVERIRMQPLALRPAEPGNAALLARAYRQEALRRTDYRSLASRRSEEPALDRMPGALLIKPLLATGIATDALLAQDATAVHVVHQSTADVQRMVTHLAGDLGIDRALLVPTGWMRGGYDFSHPDVWPPDEAIGGVRGLASLARTASDAGWLFGLHDNYEIAFESQPSTDPSVALARRNLWSGGPHQVVDPRAQVAVAMDNLDRIVPALHPDAYFLDSTTAGALLEDLDRSPPLTRRASIAASRELLDAVSERTGVVGSEDGQEWAIGHAAYFEGLASRARFPEPGRPFPLFEFAYHDAVALYWHQADSIGLTDERTRWSRTIAAAEPLLELLSTARMPLFRPPHEAWWNEAVPAGIAVTNAFARSDGGWAEGMHPLDALLKNLYEVMSPTARLAADLPMTAYEGSGGNLRTSFGDDEVVIWVRPKGGHAMNVLGPHALLQSRLHLNDRSGFLVQAPTFRAWHAWSPADEALAHGPPSTDESFMLATVQSLDGLPLEKSRRFRIYHGFGPDDFELTVDAETVLVNGEPHAVQNGRVTLHVAREALVELVGRRPSPLEGRAKARP